MSGSIIKRKSGETKALTETDLLVYDIISNKRFLAILLRLGESPKSATELITTYIYDVRGDRVITRKIPNATVYRTIKKLKALNAVQETTPLDKRKTIYSLTEYGQEILQKTLKAIKNYLNTISQPADKVYQGLNPDYMMCEASEYKKFVLTQLGVDPELLLTLIKGFHYTHQIYTKGTQYVVYSKKEG